MILINNLEIINGGSQLAIDVETNTGHTIESIVFWTMNDFKDYAKAKDLSSNLLQVNNKEVLLINASSLGIYKFEDICFIEVTSSYIDTDVCSTCASKVTGVTYNLSPYYTCLLGYLSDIASNICIDCETTKSKDTVITINMLIDSIVKCIDIGYYSQAVDLIKKLKKICSLKTCSNCPSIECPSCSNFTQI
jgi:hypothetical protein